MAQIEILKASPAEPLPADHYRVTVTNLVVPAPAIEELKRLFDLVSNLWDGTKFALQTHSSCAGIVQTAREKIFWVRNFGCDTISDEVIILAARDGYRPATLAEAIVFAAAQPDLQRQFWIVVLGSFTLDGGLRYVPVLTNGSDGRYLGDRWFGRRWGTGYRFLLVRK